MKFLIAEVFFDFDEKYTDEKQLFLKCLEEKGWIKTETDRCWKVNLEENKKEEFTFKKLNKVIKEIQNLSKIKNMDYMIISGNHLYFDH